MRKEIFVALQSGQSIGPNQFVLRRRRKKTGKENVVMKSKSKHKKPVPSEFRIFSLRVKRMGRALPSGGIPRAAIQRGRASSGVMDINLIKIRISGKQRVWAEAGSEAWNSVVRSFAGFLVPDRQLKHLLLLFRNFNCQVNYYFALYNDIYIIRFLPISFIT